MNRIAIILAGIALAANAYSQDNETIFRTEARLVLLHVSVVDKLNRPIANIPGSAFKVYEEGVEQNVRVFARENVPLSIGILLDNSQSMLGKEVQIREATLTLARSLHPEDEVFLVNFNDRVHFDQTLTRDRAAIENALLKMKPGGGTAMRDAIRNASEYLQANGTRAKKVIVVVTDGYDRTSREPEKALLARVRETDIQIYAIGLPNKSSRREANEGRRALDSLTKPTGGRSYFLESLDSIREAMPRLADELNSQYTLGYSPKDSTSDGAFRRTRVAVNGFGAPLIRTRAGYYAKPSSEPEARSPSK